MFVCIGLVSDDVFEALICLNLAASILSSDTLVQRHVDYAETVLNRFLDLLEKLFGESFFTLLVHQLSILIVERVSLEQIIILH